MTLVSVPIIVALIALFTMDPHSAPRPDDAFRGLASVASVWAPGALLWVVTWAARKHDSLWQRLQPRFRALVAASEAATLASFLYHVYMSDLGGIADRLLEVLPVSDVRRAIAVVPLVIGIVACRLAGYVLHGKTQAYGEFVRWQIKLAALPLVPFALFVLSSSALERAPLAVRLFAASHPSLQLLIVLVLIVAAYLNAPKLLRWLLPVEPLPDGELRARARVITARHDLRLDRFSVWYTRGLRIANAAVSGVLPRSREVFVTDWLLRNMDADETECVVAHEIGHVRHGHMWLYMAFSVAYFGVYFTLLGLLVPVLPKVVTDTGLGRAAIVIVFFYAYFVVLLGFLSRRLERQADYFAATNASDPQAFIRALQKLAELHALPTRIRRWVGWTKTHPPIADRTSFVERVIAGDPQARKYRRMLPVSYGLLAVLPIVGLTMFAQRDAILGSEAQLRQARAIVYLSEVERIRERIDSLPVGSPDAQQARLEAANLNADARAELAQALAAAPSDAELLYLYGLTSMYANRVDSARTEFTELLTQKPDHAGALYALATLYADRSEWDLAGDMIARADAAAPGSAQIAELRRRIELRSQDEKADNGTPR
ncbi:hypothetical protein FJZ36_03285 [Candidatus Poribacteria bacterium]|nr:hypothetical protein [Candidatus Poribacteria bacterium]